MNKLPLAKRVQILSMLCEGSSMRSVSRVAEVSVNTVTKLLIEAGEACLAIHNETVRNIASERVQCDEIWSFCYAKDRTVKSGKPMPADAGDVWTWTAIDADTKLILSYFVGDRSGQSAIAFMDDLASRLAGRVQLTTDTHRSYLDAIEGAFGGDVDYGQLVKIFGPAIGGVGRYSPPQCLGTRKRRVEGNPDPSHISTSYVERHNLTMRMSMRRFTRLTNAFSKKLDNHLHALALYFVFYNFIKQHTSLRISPAMAAGLTDHLWSFEDVVAKIDELAGPPKPRGPYRKRAAPNLLQFARRV